jgi:hypothetical protein
MHDRDSQGVGEIGRQERISRSEDRTRNVVRERTGGCELYADLMRRGALFTLKEISPTPHLPVNLVLVLVLVLTQSSVGGYEAQGAGVPGGAGDHAAEHHQLVDDEDATDAPRAGARDVDDFGELAGP